MHLETRTFKLLNQPHDRRSSYRLITLPIVPPLLRMPSLKPVHKLAADGYRKLGTFKRGLNVGCTLSRHAKIGVHAGINARAGETWRNDDDRNEAIAMSRDAWDLQANRRIRRFQSRWFRKHLAHLEDAE